MATSTTESMDFGLVAQFKDAGALLKAAEAIHKKGYRKFDTYSPFPIHGMDKAMGLGGSKLGWIVLVGGACGAMLGMGLQTWVATVGYPLIISGKPLFSWPAFIPVTFELMILFSGFATVFGMLALNKLPEFYHAIFNHSKFSVASCDGFFLAIEAVDDKFKKTDTKKDLEQAGAMQIEWVEG